jgi:hypothetical protein
VIRLSRIVPDLAIIIINRIQDFTVPFRIALRMYERGDSRRVANEDDACRLT